MNTLEITQDAAVKAHNEASKNGKALLENLFGKKVFLKDVTERVTSLETAISDLGESDPDVVDYRKLLTANVADHIIANQEAVIFTKALNEQWVPDWRNSNQRKYFNLFDLDNSAAGRFSLSGVYNRDSYSICGSRLCFKEDRLARHAANLFLDVYRRFYTI